MKYNFLGNTNLKVSKIGYGAAALCEEYGILKLWKIQSTLKQLLTYWKSLNL